MIHVPKEQNESAYLILMPRFLNYSGFINYNSIIILNDRSEQYEIDLSGGKRVRKDYSKNVYYAYGPTYIEDVIVELSDKQINEIISFMTNTKTLKVRYVGEMENIDRSLKRIEVKYIQKLLKMWVQIKK